MSKPEETDWRSWACLADEWFLAYASFPLCIDIGVKLWCIGHALELYLKAIIAKEEASSSAVMNYGHNVRKLWMACKERDSNFLPEYELRQSILNQDVMLLRATFAAGKLCADDLDHFFKHEQLYIVAAYQPDLKYWRVTMKSRPGVTTAVLVEQSPNQYWLALVKEIREYIIYPPKGIRDFLNLRVSGSTDLLDHTKEWIRVLRGPTANSLDPIV